VMIDIRSVSQNRISFVYANIPKWDICVTSVFPLYRSQRVLLVLMGMGGNLNALLSPEMYVSVCDQEQERFWKKQ
ncbi:TPA: hypothetical protein ACIVRF_003838, partial [Salmonella enterica subsp. enterica serovar Wangata]